MVQLKYDDEKNALVIDIKRWETEEDIPSSVKEEMKSYAREYPIFDKNSKKFLCSKCFGVLNEKHACDDCGVSFDFEEFPGYVDDEDATLDVLVADVTQSSWHYRTNKWFVFDVVDEEVLLYGIDMNVTYHLNHFARCVKKAFSFDVELCILVLRDKMLDLIGRREITYDDFKKEKDEFRVGEDFKFWNALNCQYDRRVYCSNLEILKDTCYRYSRIWEAKEFLKSFNSIDLFENIVYAPLCVPQFEYLVRMKLYNFAFVNAEDFVGNNFKERFGVEKSFLNFMVKYDICWNELIILRLCPIADIDVLRFMSQVCYLEDDLYHYMTDGKLNFVTLKKYFDKNEIDYDYLVDYFDYLCYAEEEGYDLTDKKVLYPENLKDSHDRLYLQREIERNPKSVAEIEAFSKELEINRYETNEYLIYPAPSLESLIIESEQQQNCVRTYGTKYANRQSQIYFMRKKSELDKSFVTIEVVDRKVVQARCKYNEEPPLHITSIIDEWEKTLN